jgi:hypothetical protein
VALVALEEVFDADAVRQLLPPRWSVATTRELPGTPSIAQHIGVAWRSGIAVSDIEAINTLADSGVPERALRPGLAFTVLVAGQQVRALIVHLKAGCRSRDLDAPLTSKDATLPEDRQDAILRLRNAAVSAAGARRGSTRTPAPTSPSWRLQRTQLREPPADSRTYWTPRRRASGDPLGRCTMARSGNRWVAQCPTARARCFPNQRRRPPGRSWRARFADLAPGGTIRKGSSGDCSIPGAHGDLTHDGIDHVLISESLKRRLAPDALTMRVVNYQDARGLRCAATPASRCRRIIARTS